MVALIFFLLNLCASIFKPKSRLAAENAALRQQLLVLQRKVCGRVQFTNSDRLFFIQLYRWCPSVLKAMVLVRPETLVRWHVPGFAATGAGNPTPREAGHQSRQNCGGLTVAMRAQLQLSSLLAIAAHFSFRCSKMMC